MMIKLRNTGAPLFLMSMLLAGAAHAQSPQVRCTQAGNVTTCRIDQPNVKQHRTPYSTVRFQPNDKVTVTAGGCVQTGGSGKTWKQFVHPSGANSDRLYHGLISIPGITGPDMERIQGVIGQTHQLPPTIDPSAAFLAIGYEDDNYDDNGYWGHDDGTEDQCKQGPGRDGGPAWVVLRIEHEAAQGTTPTHAAPFDLISTDFDPSGIPLNPHWGGETAPNVHPNAATACGGFPYIDPSNTDRGIKFGNPPCTTQGPSVNSPDGLNSAICTSGATAGHLHGHVNWWAATFKGAIRWVDHKDWTQIGDDDYDLVLTPETSTGLTASNLQTIGLEFDSDETVDHIDRGWWDEFHKAVDNNGGKSGGVPGAMIDGHEAIVVGLMGLDSEHGAYSELHPVYGLAIHLSDNPADDQWAILARNWGDEGFCSQDSMSVPINTLSFFIPRPDAATGTANTDELYSNNDKTVSVLTEPGGAVVTLELGDPSEGTLVHGKIHFAWTLRTPAPRLAKRAISVAASPAILAAIKQRATEGPETKTRALFAQLPPAKQAEVQNKLKKTPQTAYTKKVRRVQTIASPRIQGQVLRPARIPDPRKNQLKQQRLQALCEAYGGKLPGLPPQTCNSNH